MALKPRELLGFAGLCVLAGSGWLIDEWHAGLLRGMVRIAVDDAVLALLFGVASVMRRGAFAGLRRREWVEVAGWGAVLMVLPGLVQEWAGGRVSGLSETLVFTLVPVAVIFLTAQSASGFGEDKRMGPGGALAGVGGAALLIPFTAPGSAVGWAWLAAMVLTAGLAGFAAMRLHGLLRGAGVLRAAAVISGASAAAAAGFCWVGWPGLGAWDGASAAVEAGRLVLLDGPMLLLTVWLLGAMGPVGFSARYLLVPLVTIAEGIVLLRPERTWTMAAGLALMGGGGVWLLRADQEENRAEL